VVLALACPAQAEEQGALAGISKLRAADFLDSAMRRTLEDWIGQQAEILLDEEKELSAKREIRSLFNRAVRADPDNEDIPNDRFKATFAESTVKVFGPRMEDGEPTGVLMMVMILHDLRGLLSSSSLGPDGLLRALLHPTPAVKYWAARTIRLMHPTFARDVDTRNAIIDALRKAGMDEPNGLAVRQIYLAMDLSGSAEKIEFAEEVTEALVDIFEARGSGYADGDVAVSDGDLAGLSAMSRLSGPMRSTDPERARRKRYLTALTLMLCRVVEDYTAQLEMRGELGRSRRQLLGRLLRVSRGIEREFRRLIEGTDAKTDAIPDVYRKMEAGIAEEILYARNRWCGWPAETKGAKPVKGILNHESIGVAPAGGYLKTRSGRPGTQPVATRPE